MESETMADQKARLHQDVGRSTMYCHPWRLVWRLCRGKGEREIKENNIPLKCARGKNNCILPLQKRGTELWLINRSFRDA